jgi:MoaA/NifB/PqqE/SkfB family radical SAM enzyme
MSTEHLVDLTKFLGKWGVKAICYGGGGEPTINQGLAQALQACHESGMQSSMATNGTLFTPELIHAMGKYCRWVGVSVDSATPETYKKGRKVQLFNKAVGNIQLLCEHVKATGSKCDVSYKFLIFDYNQHEIFDACKLAKSLGVKDFHARPADYSHQGMSDLQKKIGGYDINEVKRQFELCHTLEDENFRVFTVVHKFDENMKPKKDFCHCYAAPCCIQLCANGGIYHCPDQRFAEEYRLGDHTNPEDILLAWGGKKHYDLVFKTGKPNCQSRCTFSTYNKQCEELFISDKDPMCRNFI